MILTQETIQYLFEYKSGFLYWKNTTNPLKIKNGTLAGSPSDENRIKIQISKRKYSASRLIFLYHHGYLPIMVDHINRDVTDDRIENLRECNYLQNNRNRTSARYSSSKYLGVSLHSNKRAWEAAVSINNKRTYIGYFNSEQAAALAYNKSAIRLYGEFANLNIIQP